MKVSRLLLVAINALVTASPIIQQSPRTLKEPAQLVKISIALQPECRQLLEQTLHELSSPSSRRYGQHLSREEAKALLRPRQTSADAVKGWLSRAGIPANDILIDGQFIHAQTVAEQAESLLGMHYNVTLGSRTIPVSSLPQAVQHHVMTIQYIPVKSSTIYPVNNSSASSAGTNLNHGHLQQPYPESHVDWEECKSKVTPACLRRLYNVGDYHAKHESRNLFGIVGFDRQAAQYDELDRFLRMFAPYASNANFSVESVNGGENPQGINVPSGEANPDIQYAAAMAYDVPIRFYATGGENHDVMPDLDLTDKENEYLEPFLEFATHLLNLDDDKLPKVVSISYGANEQLFPKPYAQQVCDMFGQLGTRGVSIVVASGDLGPGTSCQSNDGLKRPKFMPSFPATCPYVTSVGSTIGIGLERAAKFSSGGFSDYFARPKWQHGAVGNYLRLHGDEWKGYYNPRGRGFPDVAAQGVNYRYWSHGKEGLASGTSSHLPAQRPPIQEWTPSHGFLESLDLQHRQPRIHRVSQANSAIPLHHTLTPCDSITKSKSVGCSGQSRSGLEAPVIPNAGWSAVPGWDPVTGWGTPLFDRLMDLSCL